MKVSSQVKLDLLAWKPLRALALWPGFPLVLQGAALAVVVALAVLGFGVGAGMRAEELLVLRKTHLTTHSAVLIVRSWPGR
jgi:hypothetical protein